MGSAIDQIDKLFSTLTHLYGPATDDDARKIIADFLAKIRHVKPNISPYIFLDHNEYVNGLEHLDELLNAILNRRVLKITYQSFHSPAPVEIIYHPYVIRQYNYRWFVIGRNEQENHNRWVLGLDRIKNIEEENSIQYVNSPVQNWKEHFEELIGVTWPDGEKPKTVELIFTQDAAPRVITKPIHPTQKQKRLPDGRLKVTIQVVLNKELENLILSFGEQVCVESPDELRNSIVQRLSGAYRCYQS